MGALSCTHPAAIGLISLNINAYYEIQIQRQIMVLIKTLRVPWLLPEQDLDVSFPS